MGSNYLNETVATDVNARSEFSIIVAVSFHVLLSYRYMERILTRNSLYLVTMYRHLHSNVLNKSARTDLAPLMRGVTSS